MPTNATSKLLQMTFKFVELEKVSVYSRDTCIIHDIVDINVEQIGFH